MVGPAIVGQSVLGESFGEKFSKSRVFGDVRRDGTMEVILVRFFFVYGTLDGDVVGGTGGIANGRAEGGRNDGVEVIELRRKVDEDAVKTSSRPKVAGMNVGSTSWERLVDFSELWKDVVPVG